MSKFRIGDKVKRNDYFSNYSRTSLQLGETGIVTYVDHDGDVHIDGYETYIHHHSSLELAWQPTPGEMIEVRATISHPWRVREFLCMDGDLYVTRYSDDKKVFGTNIEARPIKKTHTITDSEGRTAEISEESWLEMQKFFN